MLAGINWSWESFPEYLDVLDKLPKGINYAGYMGHSALRTYVMGARRVVRSFAHSRLWNGSLNERSCKDELLLKIIEPAKKYPRAAA